MAISWAAAGVLVAIIGALCGLFYRLGKIEASKADKVTCEERADECGGKFEAANRTAAKLETAVARVQEQQIAGKENLERQMEVTVRLEGIVTKAISGGMIG